MMLLKKASIPILLSKRHTYAVAAQIHDLAIKIRPEDKEKTKVATSLIEKYVDIRKILKKIT